MTSLPWPSSPVPCVDVPVAQPQAPGKHQIPFRRGEMGPLPGPVLSTVTWAPKKSRFSYLEPQQDPSPASDSIKDHKQSKSPCIAKEIRMFHKGTPAMAAGGLDGTAAKRGVTSPAIMKSHSGLRSFWKVYQSRNSNYTVKDEDSRELRSMLGAEEASPELRKTWVRGSQPFLCLGPFRQAGEAYEAPLKIMILSA